MSTITLLIFRCRWGAPGHLWSSIGCSGVKWRICKNHFLSTFLNFYSKIKPLIVQKTRLKVLLKGLLKVGIIYVSGWAVLHNFLGARLNTLLRPFHWRGELKQSVTKTVKKILNQVSGWVFITLRTLSEWIIPKFHVLQIQFLWLFERLSLGKLKWKRCFHIHGILWPSEKETYIYQIL